MTFGPFVLGEKKSTHAPESVCTPILSRPLSKNESLATDSPMERANTAVTRRVRFKLTGKNELRWQFVLIIKPNDDCRQSVPARRRCPEAFPWPKDLPA